MGWWLLLFGLDFQRGEVYFWMCFLVYLTENTPHAVVKDEKSEHKNLKILVSI